MTNIVLYGGTRKDPKVGGGVGGTCEVTKNQTQQSPSDFGSSDVASFGSSDVASFGSSDVANFDSIYVAWFSKRGYNSYCVFLPLSSRESVVITDAAFAIYRVGKRDEPIKGYTALPYSKIKYHNIVESTTQKTFPVFGSNVCVFASAYPRANLNSPLPPTIEISLTAENTVFRPNTLRVLPLYIPSVKAKFNTIKSPTSSWDADAYIPWALPTSLESSSGPEVNGSSAIVTDPKPVGDVFVIWAWATITAVGFGPLTMS
ncbi:hypothetical protein Lal_00016928 [Lupinus albus]|nr:hypothetical protein Lal_00016928 [Lupinus albus]